MKIKSKFLFTILTLCYFNMITLASGSTEFSIEVFDNNSFVINFDNTTEAQIQVTIKDKMGVTLHDETLQQKHMNRRKYNIKNLPSGNYTLLLYYDALMKVQPIKKNNNNLEIRKDELQTIFKPIYRQHSDYLDLNMLNLSDSKILLKISDSNGNMIYEESVKHKGTIKKRFNLSQLDGGSYTFSVKMNSQLINKEFTEPIVWSPVIASL